MVTHACTLNANPNLHPNPRRGCCCDGSRNALSQTGTSNCGGEIGVMRISHTSPSRSLSLNRPWFITLIFLFLVLITEPFLVRSCWLRVISTRNILQWIDHFVSSSVGFGVCFLNLVWISGDFLWIDDFVYRYRGEGKTHY